MEFAGLDDSVALSEWSAQISEEIWRKKFDLECWGGGRGGGRGVSRGEGAYCIEGAAAYAFGAWWRLVQTASACISFQWKERLD